MTTFSALGPYRVGGLGSLSSSSSSNLSPLAEPFRVDKSLQKQNSTNTSVNYSDVPMYGPYFDPAGQLWNHSSPSTTGSKFAEIESEGMHTVRSSSAIYGYSVSQPSATVVGNHHVSSGTAAAYDPFSYDPLPNPMSTASEEGVKLHHSPYVSPLPKKDGYLSSGVSSGHGFDLLSNSSTAHSGGFGSSAPDHLQGRFRDGANKPNWGSFWSGMTGQEYWSEYAQGFGSKDSNQSDLLSSKRPSLVGGINKSQPSIVVHTHPFVDGSNNNNITDGGNMSNLKQDGYFDIFGGAYCLASLGIDHQESRSLLDCPILSNSVSSSIPRESSRLQEPFVESVTNLCGSQKANGSSPGDHFSQNDFYVFGCASTTSTLPITKNQLPYGESSSSAEGTFSALKPIPKVSVEANKSNMSAGNDYSYPIEPQMPLGLKCQSRIVIRRPPSSTLMPSSSSQIGESLDCRIGGNDITEKGHISPQMLYQVSSDNQEVKINDALAEYSIDKLSGGSDAHNPAEDSPCWRGASSNRLPFAVSESKASDGFAKKLDEWKSLNTQVCQIKSCLVDTSNCGDLFSEKVNEGNLSERPLVSERVSKFNEERCYAIQQPFCFDLNAKDGLQFADESFVSTKERCTLNKSRKNVLPGSTLGAKQISGGMEIPSPRQISEAAASEGRSKFPAVMANDSFDVPSSSENNHASSPPRDTASLKNCKATSKISDTNIDVNMLLKAMTNLSEIFLSYCFSKRASVLEQRSIAIKCVIANLNASMLMMAGETCSAVPSSEVNSSKKDLPNSHMVNVAAFEALAAAVKLGDTTEGLLDSVSCKDGPNTNGDDNITEALKKILHENFHKEEEIDQQNLLCKSLWLDAEASLCAMTAKARFLKVKAEMERKRDGTKDREIPSSSINCGDAHKTVELATCCKDSSLPSECQKSCATDKSNHAEASKRGNAGNDSNGSGSTGHDNDVGAFVMARYHKLKSSEAPSQESKESSGGHKDPLSLYASGFDSNGTTTTSDGMGDDSPVLAKYQTLNCRVNHESLNYERISSPGEDNFLPDRESSSPIYQILESQVDNSDSLYEGEDSQNSQLLSNSVGVPEAKEASVISRFSIIQSCINHSNNKDQNLVSPEVGLSELQSNGSRSEIGPFLEITEDEDVNQFDVRDHKEACLNQRSKPQKLSGEIFERWCANDCASSDREHISNIAVVSFPSSVVETTPLSSSSFEASSKPSILAVLVLSVDIKDTEVRVYRRDHVQVRSSCSSFREDRASFYCSAFGNNFYPKEYSSSWTSHTLSRFAVSN